MVKLTFLTHQKIIMQLNEKQQQAVAVIASPDFRSPFGLFGSAGVGKTFTVNHLPKTMRVAFTAPTNKAVSALIDAGCDSEHCMTIYSFLGLHINEATGKITIDKKGRSKEWDYDVLCCDEVSMNNSNICERIKLLPKSLKVVLMGDRVQAFPVGETFKPAFLMVHGNSTTLTQQMRQLQKGEQPNPLFTMLCAMREPIEAVMDKLEEKYLKGEKILPSDYICHDINFADYAKVITTNEGKKQGVTLTKNIAQFEHWIKAIFKRGDNCAVIAYHNERIDYFNAMIHEHLFPNSTAHCVGETLTFQRAFKVGNIVLATNGSAIVVESVESKQEKIIIGKFKILLNCLLINDQFLTPVNRNEFNNWLKQLQDNLAANKEAGCDYSWGEFYLLREHFADLRHSYCITALKAQGSTYDSVCGDMIDINGMISETPLHKKCIGYTAISRARNNVILLVQ